MLVECPTALVAQIIKLSSHHRKSSSIPLPTNLRYHFESVESFHSVFKLWHSRQHTYELLIGRARPRANIVKIFQFLRISIPNSDEPLTHPVIKKPSGIIYDTV